MAEHGKDLGSTTQITLGGDQCLMKAVTTRQMGGITVVEMRRPTGYGGEVPAWSMICGQGWQEAAVNNICHMANIPTADGERAAVVYAEYLSYNTVSLALRWDTPAGQPSEALVLKTLDYDELCGIRLLPNSGHVLVVLGYPDTDEEYTGLLIDISEVMMRYMLTYSFRMDEETMRAMLNDEQPPTLAFLPEGAPHDEWDELEIRGHTQTLHLRSDGQGGSAKTTETSEVHCVVSLKMSAEEMDVPDED